MVAKKKESFKLINLPNASRGDKIKVSSNQKKLSSIQTVKQKLEDTFARFVLSERKIYDDVLLKKHSAEPSSKKNLQKNTTNRFVKDSLLQRKELRNMNVQAWFSMKHIDGVIRTFVGLRPELRNVVAVFPIFNEEILQMLIKKICITYKLKDPNLSRDILFRWYIEFMEKKGLVGNFYRPALTVKGADFYVVPIHVKGNQYSLVLIANGVDSQKQKIVDIKYYDALNGKIPEELHRPLHGFFSVKADQVIFESLQIQRIEESENSSVYICLKAIDMINRGNSSNDFDPVNHHARVQAYKFLLSNALSNQDLVIKYRSTFTNDIIFQQNEMVIACNSVMDNKAYATDAEKARILCQQAMTPLMRSPKIPPKARVNDKGEIQKPTITSGHSLTPHEIFVRCRKFRQKLQSMREKLEKQPNLTDVEMAFLTWIMRTILAFEQAKDGLYGKMRPKAEVKRQINVSPPRRRRHRHIELSAFGRLISWLSQKRKATSAWVVNSTWKSLLMYCFTGAALLMFGVPIITAIGAHIAFYLPVDPLVTILGGSAFFVLGYEFVCYISKQVDFTSKKKLKPDEQLKKKTEIKAKKNKALKRDKIKSIDEIQIKADFAKQENPDLSHRDEDFINVIAKEVEEEIKQEMEYTAVKTEPDPVLYQYHPKPNHPTIKKENVNKDSTSPNPNLRRSPRFNKSN